MSNKNRGASQSHGARAESERPRRGEARRSETTSLMGCTVSVEALQEVEEKVDKVHVSGASSAVPRDIRNLLILILPMALREKAMFSPCAY